MLFTPCTPPPSVYDHVKECFSMLTILMLKPAVQRMSTAVMRQVEANLIKKFNYDHAVGRLKTIPT